MSRTRPRDHAETIERFDASAPLRFIVNAASGNGDGSAKRDLIERALRGAGRRGEVIVCRPDQIDAAAADAAAQAVAARSALISVGGDGTLNGVVQAAHRMSCPLGVIPHGTFNFFARTHGIPSEFEAALQFTLKAAPAPVQVAAVNERLFLINASVGLYPELLEDRENYKSRFGRTRGVAVGAALMTILRAHRRLRLDIERGGETRRVKTLTLFVGNNRLQLAEAGLRPPADGRITAAMLRPVGIGTLLGLVVRGAMHTLGEADSVEHFEFDHLRVRPAPAGWRRVKVAYDGEIGHLRWPLQFRVPAQPLYLLKSVHAA